VFKIYILIFIGRYIVETAHSVMFFSMSYCYFFVATTVCSKIQDGRTLIRLPAVIQADPSVYFIVFLAHTSFILMPFV